jgi:hypothetical protein
MEIVSHLGLLWLVPASCTTGAQTANVLLAGALLMRHGLPANSLAHLLWCILAFGLQCTLLLLGKSLRKSSLAVGGMYFSVSPGDTRHRQLIVGLE